MIRTLTLLLAAFIVSGCSRASQPAIAPAPVPPRPVQPPRTVSPPPASAPTPTAPLSRRPEPPRYPPAQWQAPSQPSFQPVPASPVKEATRGMDPSPYRGIAPRGEAFDTEGVSKVRRYLECLEAARKRNNEALQRIVAAGSSTPDHAITTQALDGIREMRAYFERVCDPAAVGCPQVSRLHQIMTAYFRSWSWIDDPGYYLYYGQQTQALWDQSLAEEQRVRSWLASAQR